MPRIGRGFGRGAPAGARPRERGRVMAVSFLAERAYRPRHAAPPGLFWRSLLSRKKPAATDERPQRRPESAMISRLGLVRRRRSPRSRAPATAGHGSERKHPDSAEQKDSRIRSSRCRLSHRVAWGDRTFSPAGIARCLMAAGAIAASQVNDRSAYQPSCAASAPRIAALNAHLGQASTHPGGARRRRV